MKVLSLFDGISCGRVALERAGIKVDSYTAYEIDKDAIKVSLDNYPNIKHCGDVFKAKYTKGQFDLLIGGSPCTYWSIAGARGNGTSLREVTSNGLGWDLFSQYYRALKEVQPKYFLYENNFSMSDAIKKEITKYLGVDPIMIDSADFSAQTRKRLYWTNIPVNIDYEKSSLVFSDIEYQVEHKICNYEKYKESEKCGSNIHKWDTSGKGYYSQQNRARDKNTKMNTLPASGTDKNNIYLGDFKYRKIHPIEAERCQTLPDNYTKILKSVGKRMKVIGNGWTVDVIAHILKSL